MAFRKEKYWTARVPVEEIGAFRDALLMAQRPYEQGGNNNNFNSIRDMLEELDRYKNNYDAKSWSEEFRASVAGETLMRWSPQVEFLVYLDDQPLENLETLSTQEFYEFIASLRKLYPPFRDESRKQRIKYEIFSLTLGPAVFHEVT